ncbi:MAG: hypothetical protein ABIR04_05330, partial [Cypionkella sp.]
HDLAEPFKMVVMDGHSILRVEWHTGQVPVAADAPVVRHCHAGAADGCNAVALEAQVGPKRTAEKSHLADVDDAGMSWSPSMAMFGKASGL